MNARINELLKQSIKSDGVINLFSDANSDFSLFDPKFLEEVSRMKEKNLAVELLKKLIAEQVQIYRRTNVVKSEKFSEIMQRTMNAYLNGMLTNEQVIDEIKYFNKPHLRTHHLYVCPQKSEELYRHITFRDFLRNNADAVKKYSYVKETAARLFPNDIEKYMEYKSPCIEELYTLCGLKK